MLFRFFGVLSIGVAAVLCLIAGAFEGYGWLWMLPVAALGCMVALVVLAFLYLLLLSALVDPDKEQEHDSAHYRRVLELYLESVLPVLRIHVEAKGMEKVPARGRFMLVCNHCSNVDPVLLLDRFAGYQLAFISKRENRDLFIVGKVMHKIQCQLINRENDREALRTIIKCIQILKEDRASVAVFPEGRIHDDRKLHPFRPGVFKIAQKARVPIVVCTMKNTAGVFRNMSRLRRSDVELSVVEVLSPEQFQGENTVQLARRIYTMMAESLGPENVGERE